MKVHPAISFTFMRFSSETLRFVKIRCFTSWKWHMMGMSWWYHSTLRSRPIPALTDNWTRCAGSGHTIALRH